jgi:hypothetical protein
MTQFSMESNGNEVNLRLIRSLSYIFVIFRNELVGIYDLNLFVDPLLLN